MFWFVYLSAPWFERSGSWSYGVGTGVFAFVNIYGNGWSGESFRGTFTMIKILKKFLSKNFNVFYSIFHDCLFLRSVFRD
jgi:hypothetical protein